MKSKVLQLAVLSGSVLFCLGLPARGQSSVTVQFTGTYTGTFGGVEAGVYGGKINGTKADPGIICDDYNDTVTAGETWTANAIQASSLTTSNIGQTMFGSEFGSANAGLEVYAEVAQLVSLMFSGKTSYSGSGNNITHISPGDISAAIWYITGFGSPSKWSLTSDAKALVSAVQGQFQNNLTAAETYLSSQSDLWILTPTSWSKHDGTPQEMWAKGLSVPEGGAVLAYLLLAGITCLGAMRIRSKTQSGSDTAV